MVWFSSVLIIYFISCFRFGWGAWCVMSCFLSMVFLLVDTGYCSYFLMSEWVGVDSLACLMVILCFLVLGLSLVSSCKDLKVSIMFNERVGDSMVELVVLISLGSMIFFCLGTWMDFYFFFEFSLIPTFLLILTWGYQPERLQAGLYMIMYTVCASLPLLLGLLVFWISVGTDNILLSKLLSFDFLTLNSGWIWFFISLGFFVKLPVYFFHGWLPKAHVEAPLSGSMLLAGVLLKFGAYGIIRVVWMTQMSLNSLVLAVLVFGMWGGVISSCVCICQSDLKSLIAYSSIGHMAMSLGGILSFYFIGKKAAICLLFAHGLVSPIMFSMAASVYEVVGTRSVILSKGILRLFPVFSVFWFLSCVVNMAFPPSLNFFGEIYCASSMLWLNSVFSLPLAFMVFLAGCYSLILYSWVNHGISSEMINPIWSLSSRYIFSALFCMIILLFGFLSFDFFFV